MLPSEIMLCVRLRSTGLARTRGRLLVTGCWRERMREVRRLRKIGARGKGWRRDDAGGACHA